MVSKRNRQWLLAGMVGLAFALRVAGLDLQSLWRDEVDALRFASFPLSELLRLFVSPGHNGPLYYLLLRPWLELVGRSEFALRFSSAVLGTLAVPLIYRVGRRLFPAYPGLSAVAAFLVATSPYLIWYGQEGKMYALVAALALISMERYLAALEEGGWQRWLGYMLATSAAFYVHLIAALLVPAQAVIFLIAGRETRRRGWKPWLVSMAALTLPYLPLLRWQLPLLRAQGSTGYQFVPLGAMSSSLLSNYSLGVLQGATVWLVALFVGVLLAVGLLWSRERAPWRSVGILACWLVVPVLLFYLITLVRPMYTARYLIFVLPAYLLLLSAGLAGLYRHSRLLAGLVLAVLLIVNGRGVWLQARTPLKADFRAATAYVSERRAEDDLILFQIPYGRYSFDYYYQLGQPEGVTRPATPVQRGAARVFLPLVARAGAEPYRWAEGLYTNAGLGVDQVDEQMQALTAGQKVVWLVLTEASLWDERGLVHAWLQEHARLTDQAAFVRVAVYRYELP